MNKKQWLRPLALAVVLCAGVSGLQARTPDDQLIVGFSMNNLLTLDPAAATGNDVVEVNVNLYDYLIELDALVPDKILPGLAERWSVSDDGRRITFWLRDGVRFQSGHALTADDAAWSLHASDHTSARTWMRLSATSAGTGEPRGTVPTSTISSAPRSAAGAASR